jgi:hypothetical protein
MIYQFKVIKALKHNGESYPIDTILEFRMPYADYDKFIEQTTEHLERYIGTAPAVTFNGQTFGSVSDRTNDGFKEVLAKIGENHTMSPLADNFRKNKTVKEIKTREIVKKHRDASAKAVKTAIEKRKPKFARP